MTTISVQLTGDDFDPRFLTDAGFLVAEDWPDALIFAPAALPPAGHWVSVAYLPIDRNDGYHVAHGARGYSSVRADAYASSPGAILGGLRYALAEDRAARTSGPLRLTWLGTLGEVSPFQLEIGTRFPLESSLLVGRSDDCDIVLRQGAHSDQCSVARVHAKIERTAQGAVVIDLGSTNGFDVKGQRVRQAALSPGDELAVVGTMRLRLDGTP
jgi:hypothetical protein